MTSGSWRRAARSALEKARVSTSISRWLTIDFLSRWRNSIGSSMVMMCSVRRGVDVVDHRRERGRLARAGGAGAQDQAAPLLADPLQHRRQHQLADGQDARRDDAQHQADRAALLEDVAAEAAEARHRVGDVDLELLLEALLLAGVHDRERHRDGVLLHQPLELGQRHQLAVDADDRVAAHLEVEVGRLALDRDLEQIVDVHSRSCRSARLEPPSLARQLAAPWPTGVSQPWRSCDLAGDDARELGVRMRWVTRPGPAVADRVAVDRAHRRDLGRGAGQEQLVAGVEQAARRSCSSRTSMPRSRARVITVSRVIPGRSDAASGGVTSTPSRTRKMFSPEPSLT